MRVYSNITIDLQHPRALKTVHMMQGDRSVRYVRVTITDHGATWMIPKDCKQVSVSFCKPDGKGGTYTKLQSGAAACEWTANFVNVGIHPQALTTVGFVWCNITLLGADNNALGIYPFAIDVIARPASRITSTDYLDAVSDARLVPVRADMPTDQTQIPVARSACLLAPRPGDLVLGTNGYLGRVADTDATQATVEGLGMVWGPTESFDPGSITPGAIGAVPVPTAYKADVDDVLAVAAVDAAGTPTKWRYRNMPDTLFFAPEIDIPATPYAAGDATTEINLGGFALLPEGAVRVGATVVGKNGYTADVVALDNDGDPIVRSTGDRLIDSHDADATADYNASGASTVQDWATMPAANDATSYRVREGQYRVTEEYGEVNTVEIVDSTFGNRAVRRVTVTWADDEANAYWNIYTSTTPGRIVYTSIGVDGDGSGITLQGKYYQLPPTVTAADNGSFMRVVNGLWKAVQLTNVAEVGA